MLLNSRVPSLQGSRYRRCARQNRSATRDPSKTVDQDASDLESVLETSLSLWWINDFDIDDHDDDDNNDDNN